MLNRIRLQSIAGVAVCAALAWRGDAVGAEAGAVAQLLPNGSFEAVEGDAPQGWVPSHWGGAGEQTLAAVGRSGGRSVEIASAHGADIAWSCTVPVELMSRYRLSGWIRTDAVAVRGGARGALLNVHNIQPIQTPAVTGTRDWTRVEVEFDTGFEDSVTINCLLGGWGLATGRAWYDDIALELVRSGEMPPLSVRVDAGAIGEPISKYVYGQFIEHLGRCIYGGIWAEMLEDRKFYYAVGDGESPWRALGGAAVAMTRDEPFVGEHAPRVTVAGGVAGGIAQGGLGLRAGQRYVGRIWLAGDAAAAPVCVSLVWGEGAAGRETVTIAALGAAYAQSPLAFIARASTDEARLEITAAGTGSFLVGTASLMPADNVEGMRRDTLELLRELNAPVYRWPGGNFVSGYDWRDGLGERDRRPPRKNPAWLGVEHNDFGINEFMAFCRLVGTEPYITVNTGLGSVDNAVAELEYANGAAETPQGRLRAEHGHAAPYGVKFWAIGNEMYGGWQLGHIPLEQYTARHNAFVDAMRKVDPTIQVVGVGAVGEWSERMLTDCADRMELISEHVYWQERAGLLAHVRQAPESLRRTADAHREYRQRLPSLRGRDIRICEDEWNYWYGPHVFGELGTRYFLKDALGCAAALHEFARNSDLYFMANYAQTVNVIGCVKTTKTAAALETTGLVLKLYRQRFGVLPVATEASPAIDAQAAWTEDRKALAIGVVNPSMQELRIPLELEGAALTGVGMCWQIAGSDPMAYNDPGSPPRVTIEERAVSGIGSELPVAPCSVTIFALGVK